MSGVRLKWVRGDFSLMLERQFVSARELERVRRRIARLPADSDEELRWRLDDRGPALPLPTHARISSMKEDVLEQVVDDYLKFNGYFTIHNIGFKPRPDHPDYDAAQDSVRSDVDVVGYHPGREGVNRVVVVSCKAWQAGFDATAKLAELRGEKKNPKRATWRHFRELWVPKWSEAFRAKISQLTEEETFAYRVAVTRLRGDTEAWANDPKISANLSGCSIEFLPLKEMWATMLNELTTTPAASEIGRLAQLLKAAGLTAPEVVAQPAGPVAGSEAAKQEEAENLE